MAKYKFSTAQRLALWKAHSQRCTYSREPISYDELHIDHILPEKLLQNPEELERLKLDYGLGAEFDINNYYNWIPVHSRFNLQKGGLVFDENTARYFLAIARRKYEQVVRLEQKYKRLVEKEDVLLPLNAAIESGLLSAAEAIKYLQALSESEEFQLLAELRFHEQSVSGYISRSNFENLAGLTVDYGSSIQEGLELVNNIDEQICVRTCKEFFEAKKKGFYALTTYAMKMESVFNKTCGVLQALSQAKIPKESYVNNPHIGVLNLNLLPISILASMAPEDDEERATAIANEKNIQDWVDEGLVRIKKVSQHFIHLEHRMGQMLWELLRADFNGDGLEDILVYSYSYAIRGSFGYGDVLTLTRFSTSERLFLLQEAHED